MYFQFTVDITLPCLKYLLSRVCFYGLIYGSYVKSLGSFRNFNFTCLVVSKPAFVTNVVFIKVMEMELQVVIQKINKYSMETLVFCSIPRYIITLFFCHRRVFRATHPVSSQNPKAETRNNIILIS